ncbi:MAG: carbamoyltransferase HypF, partial [Planctomycetota bacterium]
MIARLAAVRIQIRGAVQGVGFRPHVHRVAVRRGVQGWVCNDGNGVLVHAEGDAVTLDGFVAALRVEAPPTARIESLIVHPTALEPCDAFAIRASAGGPATVEIAPDLAPCDDCRREILDPNDRHFFHAYNNCTRCGPRYSIVLRLPYDRATTTMQPWPPCGECAAEFADPGNRRFHAQPVACSACGPRYALIEGDRVTGGDRKAIEAAAQRLVGGRILAIKGTGGYHLACDAFDAAAVARLRAAKVRKQKPFAILARDLAAARRLVELDEAAERLLTGAERPIVLAPARRTLPGVAPDNRDLGVMLPSTPLHELLFAAGAPEALVMTSANRSSEPIAYRDDDARARLQPMVDGFLVGERGIARRVDDSVVRSGPFGPMVLRRSRGLAPGAVAHIPTTRPILALGGDLKNTVTLVAGQHAIVSAHLGDLHHLEARRAHAEAVADLLAIYDLDRGAVLIAHDLHPEYASSRLAELLPAGPRLAVQHHRAHVASVLAERGAWDEQVVAVVGDGSGLGDDGTLWGGEFFTGSLRAGLHRAMHLRPASLPGGDAATRHPMQAAAGYLHQVDAGDLTAPPFVFSERFAAATQLVQKGVRVFSTTSMGRLFDAVAALLGFTREITFEAQAAIWLEHLARSAGSSTAVYPFPIDGDQLDWRPLLQAVVDDRRDGGDKVSIAAAFHRSVAAAVARAVELLAQRADATTVVLTGGCFQNWLLLRDTAAELQHGDLR